VRVLEICAEFVPYAKVGGLGDVTAGLSGYLAAQGHSVVIVLPNYGAVSGPVSLEQKPAMPARTATCAGKRYDYRAFKVRTDPAQPAVYLIDCPELFSGEEIYVAGEAEPLRFLLLSQAALELCEAIGFTPHIVHCHDWHTAPATVLLRAGLWPDMFAESRSVLTMHNIGYQGVFPDRLLALGRYPEALGAFGDAVAAGEVNLLRAGILCADALTTVSPTYAGEIQGPAYGYGLETLLRERRARLTGILNGVDYSSWDPRHDPMLLVPYSESSLEGKRQNRSALADMVGLRLGPAEPLVGFVSRLALQKGLDLILEALPPLLRARRFGCVFLGSGDRLYVDGLTALAAEFPGRVAFLQAQDEMMAHRIIAGSDILLVPSRYEPCGLTQMYALRYGTVPVVRQTGGLADTIVHFDPATGRGNGSVFLNADATGLAWGLGTALDWFADQALWLRLMQNGMREDFSWARQGPHFEELFASLAVLPR
jgi:starch synthase